MDEFDSQLDDLNGDDGAAGDASGSQAEDAQSGSPSDDTSNPGSDKRVNDLMSKWQKAEARIKQLEAIKNGTVETAPKAPVVSDPALKAWVDAAAEDIVDRAYNSDPRFKQYGIDPNEFRGSSPEEIRAKVKTTRGLIEKMETRIRNEILAEHGLSPDVGSSRSLPSKSFDEMSSKEFNDYVASLGM